MNDIEKVGLCWTIAALLFCIFSIVVNTSSMVLGAGLFAKIFAVIVGTLLGSIGAMLGDSIRRFAKPDMFLTNGGIGSIIGIKLFWMAGPQVIGLLIGSLVGISLVLG